MTSTVTLRWSPSRTVERLALMALVNCSSEWLPGIWCKLILDISLCAAFGSTRSRATLTIWQLWHCLPSFAYWLFCHSDQVVSTGKPPAFLYSWQGAHTSDEVWTAE